MSRRAASIGGFCAASANAAKVMYGSAAPALLVKIAGLEDEARRLLGKAERRGDLRTSVAALRELARGFELCGRALVAVGQIPATERRPMRITVDVSRDALPPLPGAIETTVVRVEDEPLSLDELPSLPGRPDTALI